MEYSVKGMNQAIMHHASGIDRQGKTSHPAPLHNL
jgi:hypothetical protein